MISVRVKKGCTLNISGKPSRELEILEKPKKVALLPEKIPFVKPRLKIKLGESVKIGTTVFEDKRNPDIKFVSPGGGEITDIEDYTPKQTDFKNEISKISDRFYKEARLDEINAMKTEFEERMGRKPRHREIILPPNINFEAIFIPSFPKDIGQIAPALSYSDIEGITLLGTNGWNSKKLVTRGGEFIEGAIFVDEDLPEDKKSFAEKNENYF